MGCQDCRKLRKRLTEVEHQQEQHAVLLVLLTVCILLVGWADRKAGKKED